MLLGLAGCGPDHIQWSLPDAHQYFPVDGARRAEFVSHDPAIAWRLVVEKTAGDDETATFTWARSDDGAVLGAVTWRSVWEGAFVLDWTDADGVTEVFDPPVRAAPDTMFRFGDWVDTHTGGRRFTSTYMGQEPCPIAWGPAFEYCVRLSLNDGDGDRSTGPIFAGEYWLVPRFGAAWMLPTGFTEKWDLADFEGTETEG